MPKSKPPRRRYRPLRRIDDFDTRMMKMYDTLEIATDKFEQKVAPFLDQIPAKERAWMVAQLARTRAEIFESRADILKPSATPVLDALMRQEAERQRQSR